MQRKKTIKKPQEKDFFQSHGHKSVLKKRNDSMGIYFGHILLLNWLTCLDETKPKNMFAESVRYEYQDMSPEANFLDNSQFWSKLYLMHKEKKGAD